MTVDSRGHIDGLGEFLLFVAVDLASRTLRKVDSIANLNNVPATNFRYCLEAIFPPLRVFGNACNSRANTIPDPD